MSRIDPHLRHDFSHPPPLRPSSSRSRSRSPWWSRWSSPWWSRWSSPWRWSSPERPDPEVATLQLLVAALLLIVTLETILLILAAAPPAH
jgi:hypothetical protein